MFTTKITFNFWFPIYRMGHAGAQLAETLRYKPEGRGFDSPMVSFEFFTPSGRTMALGLTQPRIEMSTSNVSRVVKTIGA
jgi:hypothetical protein